MAQRVNPVKTLTRHLHAALDHAQTDHGPLVGIGPPELEHELELSQEVPPADGEESRGGD